MSLAEDDRKLLFERLVAEQGIDCLAACDHILLGTCAAIGLCQQMLDACICFGKRLLAEEAVSALFKEESIKLLHGTKLVL